MLQMGFSQEEIQDSLVNQKYNDVMATYLLLDYRNSEVTQVFFLNHASPCNTRVIITMQGAVCQS